MNVSVLPRQAGRKTGETISHRKNFTPAQRFSLLMGSSPSFSVLCPGALHGGSDEANHAVVDV